MKSFLPNGLGLFAVDPCIHLIAFQRNKAGLVVETFALFPLTGPAKTAEAVSRGLGTDSGRTEKRGKHGGFKQLS